jgi:hypothetical protein
MYVDALKRLKNEFAAFEKDVDSSRIRELAIKSEPVVHYKKKQSEE